MALAEETPERLDQERLRHVFSAITSEYVCNISYCYHVASESGSQSTEIVDAARRAIENYRGLFDLATPCSEEWEFLLAIDPIIVSLARGISTRQWRRDRRLKVIESQRSDAISQVAESTKYAGFLRGIVQLAGLGGFGYFFARTLTDTFHLGAESITRQSGYASLAAAFALILSGSVVRARLINRRMATIYNRSRCDQLQAEQEYDISALTEYRRAIRDTREAWRRYAKAEPPDIPGRELEVEGRIHRREQQMEDEEQSGTWARMKSIFGRRLPPSDADIDEGIRKEEPS